MFSRIKAWGEYVLKIFKPCGISSLSEGGFDMAITPVHNTVATMDSMMTPIVAKSQIIQAPQSSVDLSNDPDRIYKTRSDTLEAANPIALATEESASDMVISGCQTQQDSIKDVSPIPADSATPATEAEHLSTTTVATMDSMMTPIVAESQTIQSLQPSADGLSFIIGED
ncbi:hypothetical protein BASA61_002809 [Batrachochytrium salamandrivorans]|nr:hypothetical protein BASA61_002809 [Batrachochytrium salamandrivorans]